MGQKQTHKLLEAAKDIAAKEARKLLKKRGTASPRDMRMAAGADCSGAVCAFACATGCAVVCLASGGVGTAIAALGGTIGGSGTAIGIQSGQKPNLTTSRKI